MKNLQGTAITKRAAAARLTFAGALMLSFSLAVVFGGGAPALAQTAKIEEMTVEQILALPKPDQKAALEEYVKLHPDDPKGHFQLGNWYYDQFNAEEALAQYKKVLSLSPDDFKALVNACIVLESTKKGDEALAMYEEFIARHPNDAVALAYYGETQWGLGRKSQAVDTYRKALSIDPNCPEAHFNLGVAFAEMGILREAVREWEAVAKAGKPEDLVARAKENLKRAEERL
jgi:tetratricopeptide (TPR) repeat protein